MLLALCFNNFKSAAFKSCIYCKLSSSCFKKKFSLKSPSFFYFSLFLARELSIRCNFRENGPQSPNVFFTLFLLLENTTLKKKRGGFCRPQTMEINLVRLQAPRSFQIGNVSWRVCCVLPNRRWAGACPVLPKVSVSSFVVPGGSSGVREIASHCGALSRVASRFGIGRAPNPPHRCRHCLHNARYLTGSIPLRRQHRFL